MGKKKRKGPHKDQYKQIGYDPYYPQGYNVIEKEITDEMHNDTHPSLNSNAQNPNDAKDKDSRTLKESEIAINDSIANKKEEPTKESLKALQEELITDQVLTPPQKELKDNNDKDIDQGIQINDNANSPIMDIPLGIEFNEEYENEIKDLQNDKLERRNSEVIEDINFEMMPALNVKENEDEDETRTRENAKVNVLILDDIIDGETYEEVLPEANEGDDDDDNCFEMKHEKPQCQVDEIEPQIEIESAHKSPDKPIRLNLKSDNRNKEFNTNEDNLNHEPEFIVISKPNLIQEAKSKTIDDENYDFEKANKKPEASRKANIVQNKNKTKRTYNVSSGQIDSNSNLLTRDFESERKTEKNNKDLSQSYNPTEINETGIIRYTVDVPKATTNILNDPKAFVPAKRIPVIYPPKYDSCCIIQ